MITRPSTVALLFQLQQVAASSPTANSPESRFQSTRSTPGVGLHSYPCLYCKRQAHATMEEHELCCKYDSHREVARLILRAYTLSFLLLATVVLWTAGDACLYWGFSYLDNRYSGGLSTHLHRHHVHQRTLASTALGCFAGSCRGHS